MTIRLLGTGSIWAKELGSCALIDDSLLLDCPTGLIKTLKRESFNIAKIDVCILTHFHADHYFDVPFLLLEQGMRAPREGELTIIGPKGLTEKIKALFCLAYLELWDTISRNIVINFIEVNESQRSITCMDYVITPYKVNHNQCDAFGYTIEKSGKIVGFTGDTLLCENVEKIIRASQISFVDMTFEKNSCAHMGFNNMVALKAQYADAHQIVPTHMGNEVRTLYNKKYNDAPLDGTDYCI